MNIVKLILVSVCILLLADCININGKETKQCKNTCSTTSILLYTTVQSQQSNSCSANSVPGSTSSTNSQLYQSCLTSANLTASRIVSSYRESCNKKCK